MIKKNLKRTSTSLEEKEMATLLQKIKTIIHQRYRGIFVNLKAERKGVKITLHAYNTGVDETTQALADTRDLLAKNGLTPYPLTKPTLES